MQTVSVWLSTRAITFGCVESINCNDDPSFFMFALMTRTSAEPVFKLSPRREDPEDRVVKQAPASPGQDYRLNKRARFRAHCPSVTRVSLFITCVSWVGNTVSSLSLHGCRRKHTESSPLRCNTRSSASLKPRRSRRQQLAPYLYVNSTTTATTSAVRNNIKRCRCVYP